MRLEPKPRSDDQSHFLTDMLEVVAKSSLPIQAVYLCSLARSVALTMLLYLAHCGSITLHLISFYLWCDSYAQPSLTGFEHARYSTIMLQAQRANQLSYPPPVTYPA